MIKPVLYDQVIFRVPRFSYEDDIADNWDELKQMVAYSSPEFFKIIKHMTCGDLSMAERKIQLTLRKYYNRATFRSTPYGTFSTVGIGSSDWQKNSVVVLNQTIKSHCFHDWRNAVKEKGLSFDADVSFFSNTTFYSVQNEIRYIQKIENEFHVAVIDFDTVIYEVLNFCTVPKRIEQVTGHFGELDKNELIALIRELSDLQLLFSSHHTNIIGEDYFSRCRINNGNGAGVRQYVIAERQAKSGTFDKAIFRHLPELVQNLQQIGMAYHSSELKEFRNRFIRKYEQAEVPLMEALDPEIGLGYGAFANHVTKSPITKLAVKVKADNNYHPDSNTLREKLYQQILENAKTGNPIDLGKLTEANPSSLLLPNSFNAVCTVSDGNIWLESMGGATATALSGRFALAIQEIHKYCKEIAELEQSSNPDVLFFDIGYTKEADVDNINRRPSIYHHQLNILNYDTSAIPLCINDILISVRHGQVVLRSRSSGKRLIPRTASAYNHKRSDLALMRLLMDIQYQGLIVDHLISPSDIIPGLAYYPRIQFRNIILSPATWQIQSTLLKDISGWSAKCAFLREHLKGTVNCTYVKTGFADQMLCLRINSLPDIELMVSILEKQKQMYLKEAEITAIPIAVNDRLKPMLPQLVVTLAHRNEIYKPLSTTTGATLHIGNTEYVAPGKDWLYFEIYINPFRSDLILDGKIKNYLQSNQDKIKSWFFIRYTEDGDHIRLRLRLSAPQYGYLLIGELTELIGEDLDAGFVSDIKLRTYKKEIQRYSSQIMEKVEDHFYKDSEFVLSMLSGMLSDMAKYSLCVNLIEVIAGTNLLTDEAFIKAVNTITTHLSEEHKCTTSDFKEINQLYRSYVTEDYPSLSEKSTELHETLVVSFIETIREYEDSRRPQILTDLIHMHINRLFAADQRMHELVIYTFYLLKEKSRMHKGGNPSQRARYS